MSNFQEKLNTEWVEAINLLESVDYDCSNLETVEDVEEIYYSLDIVEDGVWNEDEQMYFTDLEEGKDYLRENHVDVNMADTDEEREELIDEFSFESCGPYIENLNKCEQWPIEPADVRTLYAFMDWVQNWKQKEELANQLNETLSTKVEKKKSIKI